MIFFKLNKFFFLFFIEKYIFVFYFYILMIFGKKKKIEELKRENADLKEKLQDALEKIDNLTEKISEIYEQNQEKNQNNMNQEQQKQEKEKKNHNEIIDDEDITNIDVYIRKIAQAKSPQEIENLRAKRRLLMQVRRAELNRQKIDYSKVGRKRKYDVENMGENVGGENMDMNQIWEIYDNLNPIIKNLVKGYVKNKTGLDIEELRSNPERLMSLLSQFISQQRQEQNQNTNQEQQKQEKLSIDELKRRDDILEKEILEKRKT